MNYKDKIEEVITQALTEKTFSLEIIEKIKSLKDGFESAQENIKIQNLALESSNKTIEDLRLKNSELSTKVKLFEDREIAIASKEKVLEKTEYQLTFQTQRANEIKELFGTVFKNPTLQRSVFGTIPVMENGYLQQRNSNSTETETIN